MLEYYEKRKLRKILYSKPVIALLFIPTGFLGMTAWHAFEKERATHSIAAAVASELIGLQSRQQVLKAEVDRLSTTRGIEEEIRKKFDVAREGEHVIVLVDKEGGEHAPQSEPEKEKGIFSAIFDIFGL